MIVRAARGRWAPGLARVLAAFPIDACVFLVAWSGTQRLLGVSWRADQPWQDLPADTPPREFLAAARVYREGQRLVHADGRPVRRTRLVEFVLPALSFGAYLAVPVLFRGRTPGRVAAGWAPVAHGGRLPRRRQVLVRETTPLLVSGLRSLVARGPNLERRGNRGLRGLVLVAQLLLRARDPRRRGLGDRVAGTRPRRTS